MKNFGNFFNNSKSGESTHTVQQQHTIRGRQIQEEKLLSEGGFGYIWRAFDINTREVFALKRMICQGQERVQLAKNEMHNLEILPSHANLIKFYGGSIVPTQEGCVALYLMELCDGGSLFDLMSATIPNKIPERKLIQIITQAAKGIRALHTLNPPVTHRDIKIENILLSNGVYKLCDFGSCSSQVIDFKRVPKSQYDQYEDQFSKSTTMMYRPPEMCEPARQFLVDTKVDIWMLGCVLYTIAFYVHPFVDNMKVAIIDANYRFPEDSKYSMKLHDFIRHMITPDPAYRPTIHDVIQICENFDNIPSIQLNPVAQSIKERDEARKREEERSGKKMKKFDGDIPMEELMKLQERIRKQAAGEEDPADEGEEENDEEEGGIRVSEQRVASSLQYQPKQQDDSYSFVKNKPQPVKKSAAQRQTDRQLEQIKQQFSKGNNYQMNNTNTTTTQKFNSNGSNNKNNTNNNNFDNSGWGNFGSSNTNAIKTTSDPFAQFGFQTNPAPANNNNSNNNIFEQFGQSSTSQATTNSNSAFDAFNFASSEPTQKQQQFNSNPNNNNKTSNQDGNIWEFFEGNDDNSNNNYSQKQQVSYIPASDPFGQNTIQSSNLADTNSAFMQQQFQIAAQFNSQNSQKASNQQQQQQKVQQYQPQPPNVDLLDLGMEQPASKKEQTGAFNLLDLGLTL